MTKQSGLAPIIIIGSTLAVLLALTISFIIFGLRQTSPKGGQTTQTIQTVIKPDEQKECTNSDYGGCDNEKNFYQWQDDGLRK